MRVAIIGAGWYGSHIAYVLKKKFGHDITLFEKNDDIFSGISGKFGIRLHAGPHYPRSDDTRDNCHEMFEQFCLAYPKLIEENAYSIYALGDKDADGEAPKIDQAKFEAVCNEFNAVNKVDLQASGYSNLTSAMNLQEPSIVIGDRLRNTFKQYLQEAEVKVKCKFEVKGIKKHSDGQFVIDADEKTESFDRVINATSYQSLLPPEKPLPLGLKVAYQPCVALVYKDKQSTERPFSFIVMDGWFPCVMPYGDPVQKENTIERKYIMTHGKWTLLGSFETAQEADVCLAATDDEFIEQQVKPRCERDIDRFWPGFKERFEYCGWEGSTLAKVITNGEFRSSITIEKDGVIHIIPGKVSNIFNAEKEVLALINNENIINHGEGYRYVSKGTLDNATQEFKEKLTVKNTCMLQPYQELFATVNDSNQEEQLNTSISEHSNDGSTCSTVADSLTPQSALSSQGFFKRSPSRDQMFPVTPPSFLLSDHKRTSEEETLSPFLLEFDDILETSSPSFSPSQSAAPTAIASPSFALTRMFRAIPPSPSPSPVNDERDLRNSRCQTP